MSTDPFPSRAPGGHLLDVLRQAPIVQGLSEEELAGLLARNRIITCARGEVIIEEGSFGRELYIVLEGTLAVVKDPARLGTIERGSIEPRVIATIERGQSFGEMALVGRGPRDATIVALQDQTTLLVLEPDVFDNAIPAQAILNNITADLAAKLQTRNVEFLRNVLSSYYLTALVEELATGAYACSPIVPLQKLVVIRDPENYILSGPGRILADSPDKEMVEFLVFSDPAVLQRLAGPGTPSGAIIFNALFSLLGSGDISQRIDAVNFRHRIEPNSQGRTGTLAVDKTTGVEKRTYTLRWQIKGAHYQHNTRISSAHVCLYIHDDETASTAQEAQQVINTIAMPVQKSIAANLPRQPHDTLKTRVMVIHHRTHEVARTLETVRNLGYQIDTFIGIPYGDVNWEYITMLDHAAGHNYLSLKLITHPTEPTRYEFDFQQSSFLDAQTERDLAALYADPAICTSYGTAMGSLAEYRVLRALQRCMDHGERLIVYEDGGYIVDRIYAIYYDARHPCHALMKSAVDTRVILGVVEVTVAGERRNLQLIADNGGQALLPVLSNARSDIKTVYEAVGVAEAVIHASATSFGRLGLPTFQNRRVAVIGGNGAIGTRLVEQFTSLHNSTANIFCIDVSRRSFALPLDRAALPFAATRLAYRRLPRYTVTDGCTPVILDWQYGDEHFQVNLEAIDRAIGAFLEGADDGRELAITSSYPLSPDDGSRLWQHIDVASGYRLVSADPLPDDTGMRYQLQADGTSRVVSLLAAPTVLTFPSMTRLIQAGIDTVVGCTGYPVFSARNLDDFLARPSPFAVDELALISASSKDYEFRQANEFLNVLLNLHARATISEDTRLSWFAGFYQQALSFVLDADFGALQGLLTSTLDDQVIQAFRNSAPGVAGAMCLSDQTRAVWRGRIADYVADKVRAAVAIRKEIRPDIGSVYHLTVNGQSKRVVLLADGLVVNFFARHEKGVKTEYIDPIVSMQVLSLVKLMNESIAPGVHKMDDHLSSADLATLWGAIDDNCRPLAIG
jgi:CRP-like cAMP-binding protein